MKGVIFNEFIEMMDERFGAETAEEVIDEAAPASGAAYTRVGNYDHGELLDMVVHLSRRTGAPVPDLVRAFGEFLFPRLMAAFPGTVSQASDSFAFLGGIEDTIHTAVRKIHPDSELPHFTVERLDQKEMILLYRSSRPFAPLAEGLIAGCAAYFGEEVAIRREDLPPGDGTHARFRLART